MALPAASAFTDSAVTEAGFKTAITDLVNYLAALETTPVGTIGAFGMSSAPTGWLKCNGAAISRTTYASLFTKIGTTFGAGDGTTTFNLPDLRGYFPRAWDDGRGVDSGRALGSSQEDANLSHTHTTVSNGEHTHTLTCAWVWSSNTVHPSNQSGYKGDIHGSGNTGSNGAHAHTINSSGGAEARPKNIALLFCIKY